MTPTDEMREPVHAALTAALAAEVAAMEADGDSLDFVRRAPDAGLPEIARTYAARLNAWANDHHGSGASLGGIALDLLAALRSSSASGGVSTLDLDAIEAEHYAWTPDEGGGEYCVECGVRFPCPPRALVAEVRRLSGATEPATAKHGPCAICAERGGQTLAGAYLCEKHLIEFEDWRTARDRAEPAPAAEYEYGTGREGGFIQRWASERTARTPPNAAALCCCAPSPITATPMPEEQAAREPRSGSCVCPSGMPTRAEPRPSLTGTKPCACTTHLATGS